MDDLAKYLKISDDIKDFTLNTPTGKFTTFGTSLDYLKFHGLVPFSQTVVKRPYVSIPYGFYSPHELGLNLPRCAQISIGYCNLYAKWKRRWTLQGRSWYIENTKEWGLEIAHAHGSHICMKNGYYVYQAQGVPEETIWHEYAHILADCEKHGHDDVWKKLARGLGHPDPGPWTRFSYEGEPLTSWGT